MCAVRFCLRNRLLKLRIKIIKSTRTTLFACKYSKKEKEASTCGNQSGVLSRDLVAVLACTSDRRLPEVKGNPAVKSASTPQVPEKVARVRTNSVTAVTSPPVVQTRKRTSSGVFQVDETEPPPKKTEHTRSNSDGALKRKAMTNGRRKVTETSECEGERKKEMDITVEKEGKKDRDKISEKGRKVVQEDKGKIIERFDSNEKGKCVSAFKESDSWD